MISCIISGGQTGADRGGLLAGLRLGLRTGGWAPLGWWTENGSAEKQLRSLGLKEHRGRGYRPRTAANIRDSDGTALFVRTRNSAGSRLTRQLAKKQGKPLIEIPVLDNLSCLFETTETRVQKIQTWLVQHNIKTVNVAGNRESVAPGIAEEVAFFLTKALDQLREV